MVAVAIGGAAILGAGASVVSGNKAASTATKTANQQISEERRQYDTTRADFAPWRETGAGALSKLAGMYGVTPPSSTTGTPPGGTTDAGAYGGFFTSPGYQFRVDEGNKAIERSAAARGLRMSGPALKAIDRYTQDYASSEYDKFVSGLQTLSGFGQSATGSTARAGEAATAGVTNAIGAAGNARASSYLNTGAAINNGLQNAVGAYLYSAGGGFGGGNTTRYPGTPPYAG